MIELRWLELETPQFVYGVGLEKLELSLPFGLLVVGLKPFTIKLLNAPIHHPKQFTRGKG